MFLDRGTSGGDGLVTHHQASVVNTPILSQTGGQTSLSYTGHYERRALIRKEGAHALVDAHNTLVKEIMASGAISTAQKNIILSMEQEGVNAGGEFFGQIQENNTAHRIPHKEGMSRHNALQGTPDILRGSIRLRMWELVTN